MSKDTTEKTNNGKSDAIAAALAQIEKSYGKGSVFLGNSKVSNIETHSSGSIAIDEALGGGYAKGRIVEIYGPESSGKTTLTLHAIAEVQKAGGTCAFIDAEHALDTNYAHKLGVDTDKMIISQPDYGEQALEIVNTLVNSGGIDMIIVDSVAALVPKAELEGDMGDSHIGLQARMMSQALRKLAGTISKTNTTVIFINQLRQKIGVMFGSPETTTGGNSLKFYASLRIDIRRKDKIETGSGDNKEVVGNVTHIKVVKNKIAPPFRETDVEIIYNEGISKTAEALDMGVETDVVRKAGAYYSYGETKLGQGKESAKLFLKDNPKILSAIIADIRKELAK